MSDHFNPFIAKLLRLSFANHWLSYEDAKEKIKANLKNNIPFSYARFGDGELHYLKEYFKLAENDLSFIELRSLGTALPHMSIEAINYHEEMMDIFYERRNLGHDKIEERNTISLAVGKGIMNALRNSDMIGVFSINDIDNPDNNTLTTHSYVPQTDLLAKCGVDFKSLVSVKLNRDPIFANPYEFKELLDRRPIHIMTGHAYELENVTKIHKILNCDITYTDIPLNPGSPKGFSLYHKENIIKTLHSIEEDIVIYALGGFCKDIPSILSKEYGKMVLDLGAVTDAWAGKITRPYMKDESYMLIGNPDSIIVDDLHGS